jgi:hypothetical protein
MQHIGQIAQVQIQTRPLKQRDARGKFYDPAGLIAVDGIEVSTDGVLGLLEAGPQQDVHHVAHPNSRNRAGRNGFSIGISGHYDALRARFGDHIEDGIAGENLVIACSQAFAKDEMSGGLIVESAAGLVRLAVEQFIEPCEEFSHYANRSANPLPADQLKDTLQFLRHGRRGFFAALVDHEAAVFRPGDLIYLQNS